MGAVLIDGRNCAYRAVYANRANKDDNSRYHSAIIMMRFLRAWIDRIKMHHDDGLSIHVFWDAERSTVWRRKLLETYKLRDSQDPAIKQDLHVTQEAAKAMFTHMGVRQYARDRMEADDLIYAMCCVLPRDKKVTIISSDSDFLQIPYRITNAQLYNPNDSNIVTVPAGIDPVVKKALIGDKIDNIDGFDGIGPVKGERLARSLSDTYAYVTATDYAKFHLNVMLIDLSLCPYLLSNRAYVSRILSNQCVAFDRDEIMKLALSHQINGLPQEYSSAILPFKNWDNKVS